MRNLSKNEMIHLSGGYWSKIWDGVKIAFGIALGEDLIDVWKEGWNDPYGID